MKSPFAILLGLTLSALASPEAPLVVDPHVMKSDQEFLAKHANGTKEAAPSPSAQPRQTEGPALSAAGSGAPADAVKSAPPIAAPPIAPNGSQVSRVTPKAKATPAPPPRIASRIPGLPPETMADVTQVPEYKPDPRDEEWDRDRDRAYAAANAWDRALQMERERAWAAERERDEDRAPDDWRDRPRRRSETIRLPSPDELPRKVQHVRRFIHRLLPF